jgi:hypothetical protein
MSRSALGKSGRAKVAFLLTLTLMMAISVPLEVASAQSSSYYHMKYTWSYKGDWTWNLDVPQALYDAYKAVPLATRENNGIEGYGFLVTTHDNYIQSLTDKLTQISNEQGFSEYEKVSFTLAFVQSLPYTSDDVTTGHDEYPRFPVETLVDNGGDCEDTSILFATIVKQMGYGVVFINPEGHYAVGVLGEDSLEGSYYNYPADSSNRYYYCETTGEGFGIGELPEDYVGQTAYIYPIYESRQYEPHIQIATTDTPTDEPTDTSTATLSPTVSFTPDTTQNPDVFALLGNTGLYIIVIAVAAIFAVIAIIIVAVSKTRSQPKQQPQPQFQPPPPPPPPPPN